MKSRIFLSLVATVIALGSFGCTYNTGHEHDRHARGSYHAERGGHYGGYERHHDRCD